MPLRRNTRSIYSRVGLDIGSHTINGVEVVERGPETVIRSAGSAAIPGIKGKLYSPEPSAVVQAIRNLWSTAGFESKQVVLALPNEAVYVKWLHLEAENEEELGQTARGAAARGAPFPASDAIVDYRVLSSRTTTSGTVHFVMLVAASATAVDDVLNISEAAGLEPLAVDIRSAAALRSLESQKRAGGPLWSGQPRAHLIIGAASTVIVVARGSLMEFVRNVPIGGNDLTDCIAQHTGVSWPEAEQIKTAPGTRLTEGGVLASWHDGEEIRIDCEAAVGRLAREALRSLRFFRSQFAEGSYLGMIGGASLSGGGALLKGIDACLQEQGIDVTSIVNPFTGFSVAAGAGRMQQVMDSATAYTTAVGLALGDYQNEQPREDEAAAAAA